MNIVCHGRLDPPASGQGAEKGSNEHDAELSVPVKGGELSSRGMRLVFSRSDLSFNL